MPDAAAAQVEVGARDDRARPGCWPDAWWRPDPDPLGAARARPGRPPSARRPRVARHIGAGQMAHQPGDLDPAGRLRGGQRVQQTGELRRPDAVAAEPGVDLQMNPRRRGRPTGWQRGPRPGGRGWRCPGRPRPPPRARTSSPPATARPTPGRRYRPHAAPAPPSGWQHPGRTRPPRERRQRRLPGAVPVTVGLDHGHQIRGRGVPSQRGQQQPGVAGDGVGVDHRLGPDRRTVQGYSPHDGITSGGRPAAAWPRRGGPTAPGHRKVRFARRPPPPGRAGKRPPRRRSTAAGRWRASEPITPDSTSPEPAVASQDDPDRFTAACPPGSAIRVRWPLSSTVAPLCAAALRTAASRSPRSMSGNTRVNSRSCGVSRVCCPARRRIDEQ